MSQPVCTVMVGLPAMGKSTLVEGMWKDTDTFVYSTDDLIEAAAKELGSTYNEVFETLIKSVTEAANASLDVAVKKRQDIIWDQTNLSVKKRSSIIKKFTKTDYQFECVCIVPPEEGHFSDLKDWKYRLANRPGKIIPQHIISQMYKSYVEPTLDEGFNKITFYNMFGAKLQQLSK